MQVTLYVKTDDQHKDELRTNLQRLFQVEPVIRDIPTGIDTDFSQLESLADLLDAKTTTTPHVLLTLESPDLTPEQEAFLNTVDIQYDMTKREFTPEEILQGLMEKE